MSDATPPFPTEEYIAGRVHGRTAGLKETLKVRLRRITGGALLGGAAAALIIASPATTGRSALSWPIALSIFSGFVILGGIGIVRAVLSFRRGMRHLRDDIIRSVMSPNNPTPRRVRFHRWWLRGEASGQQPWKKAATDGANEFHRKY